MLSLASGEHRRKEIPFVRSSCYAASDEPKASIVNRTENLYENIIIILVQYNTLIQGMGSATLRRRPCSESSLSKKVTVSFMMPFR